MTSLERSIVTYLHGHPGEITTMAVLAMALANPDDVIHGRQHRVSQAIVSLRRHGWLVDVVERCPTCGRPPRYRQPVALWLTALGEYEASQWDDRSHQEVAQIETM